jgi:hypothetical protein
MTSLVRLARRLRYGRPIIVVSGLPRSGTSMMMQMLEAGGLPVVTDGLRAADVSNPKGYYELEAVKSLAKDLDPAWLADARGKAVKIVSAHIGWLPETYEYRTLFMQRSLDEVMASQNRMLVDRGMPAGTEETDRARAAYERHLTDTLRLMTARPCFSTLLVDYKETLAHPAEAARRIERFLSMRLDVTRMARSADRTLYRNRSEPAME